MNNLLILHKYEPVQIIPFVGVYTLCNLSFFATQEEDRDPDYRNIALELCDGSLHDLFYGENLAAKKQLRDLALNKDSITQLLKDATRGLHHLHSMNPPICEFYLMYIVIMLVHSQ